MSTFDKWSPEALLDVASSIRILMSDAGENLDVPCENLDDFAQDLVAEAFRQFAALRDPNRSLEYLHRSVMGNTLRYVCSYDPISDLIWCVEDGGLVVLPPIGTKGPLEHLESNELISCIVYDRHGKLRANAVIHEHTRRVLRIDFIARREP